MTYDTSSRGGLRDISSRAPIQAPDDSGREVQEIVERLTQLGRLLFAHGAIIGGDRVSGRSRDGYGDEEVVGLAVAVEVAADLAASATHLLSAGHAYSAAVLLRQIIEVEYLVWLFANDPEAARAWLNAGDDELRSTFRPATIRKKAAGHFSNDEYHYHCEVGGHPTPHARDLLGSHSRGGDASWLSGANFGVTSIGCGTASKRLWIVWTCITRCLQQPTYDLPAASSKMRRPYPV